MAPIRPSTNKSGGLKQGTLAFASTKRTGSTSTTGKQKKVAPSAFSATERSTSDSERSGASTPVQVSDKHSKDYKEQKQDAPRSLRPAKRRHVSPSPEVELPPPQDESTKGIAVREERPRLDPKDRRWSGIRKTAKAKMGDAAPVHPENENEIHRVLRIFDLSDEFGPCIGVSRLERWERAYVMGLNPPQEIREILDTMEGSEKPEYSQCVFHDLV